MFMYVYRAINNKTPLKNFVDPKSLGGSYYSKNRQFFLRSYYSKKILSNLGSRRLIFRQTFRFRFDIPLKYP